MAHGNLRAAVMGVLCASVCVTLRRGNASAGSARKFSLTFLTPFLLVGSKPPLSGTWGQERA